MEKDLQLYIAASYGNYEQVEDLLTNADCDVNFINTERNGNTPLYIAASWGSLDHIKVIESLLENGAKIDLKNDSLQTPLYVAASWGNAHVVSLLIKAGADVTLRNHQRRTPLHIATCPKPHLAEFTDFSKSKYPSCADAGTMILYNVAKMCMTKSLPKYSDYLPNFEEDYKMLLNLDVSKLVRVPDYVLEIVLYYNHFAVTVALVEAGACINAIDHLRQTPLDKARIWGHDAIMKYLVANGAVEGSKLSVEKPSSKNLANEGS